MASEFSGGGRKWGEEEKLNDLGLGDWETQTQTQKNLSLPSPDCLGRRAGIQLSLFQSLVSPPLPRAGAAGGREGEGEIIRGV